MEETYRILFCGRAEQCRAIDASMHGDGTRYFVTTVFWRQAPVDLIGRAVRSGAPFDVAVVTAEWLKADAPTLLQPMLDADPRLPVILQMADAGTGHDPVLSDRLMLVPPDDARTRQLVVALASARRAEEARQNAESQLASSHRAYQLVSLEFQRQNRRLQEQEERLRVQKELFETALNNMSQGLCMFDASGALVVCNRRYLEMYGLSDELVAPGIALGDILAERRRVGNFDDDPQRYSAEMAAAMAEGEPHNVLSTTDERTILIVNQPMAGGGWVATHEDITERFKAEEQIRYLARHDSLTGLPNRAAFRDEMEHALANLRAADTLAVLCLDLDYFKNVNDTLGHLIGDKLLCAVTERLRERVGPGDTVARLGGDEFAILFPGGGPSPAGVLAQRLIAGINQPYEIDGHHVVVSASIGLAFSPGDGATSEQLLRNADMALYRAKSAGRSAFRFFEAAMDAQLQARRLLELDLRKALDNGEFELLYQPQINAATEVVTGCEALLRWRHPVRGLVSPADFIPLAEEIGLIVPIGDWVLRTACAEAASWPVPISIAVNLSPAQFKSRTLIDSVVAAVIQSSLEPSRLELEITESVLLHDNEATLALLHELRNYGIRISMDDFGTGYSSLSYLRSFPFDKIKIDRSFINDLSGQGGSSAIIKAVAGLGRGLGIMTTAEGVETREQLELIRAEGCTEVQGYLFSPPVPAARLMDIVTGGFTATAEAA
ncbi:EAL domain-containing protein [Xanthobacteraceae bacterium Astr-EGSB]|uniref:putative bifunctional diguanylate cyclase/phosphodiesterase n=1 Tax=Astrobacterium formosum TaxID=3069710 RepID=UPI0027B16F0E|nr:EAL domain-containing protein [Xanthobacteraceae bacterium Astr-EGSB]